MSLRIRITKKMKSVVILLVLVLALAGLIVSSSPAASGSQSSGFLGDSQTQQQESPSPKKACVLIGDTSGLLGDVNHDYAVMSALIAEERFKSENYDVTFIKYATAQDVCDCINNPEVEALWIWGHGGREAYDGKTRPAPWVSMCPIDGYDTYLVPANQADRLPLPPARPAEEFCIVPVNGAPTHINHVTLQSCSQKKFKDDWQSAFPGTKDGKFYSWKGKVNVIWAFFWQLCFWTPALSSCLPPPEIHPQIQGPDRIVYDETRGIYYHDISYVSNDYELSELLSSQFGSQAINFYTVVPSTGDQLLLFGVDIENGTIVQQYSEPIPEPTVDVLVTAEALYQILENPATILSAYLHGDFQITNYVPIDLDIVLMGTAMLFFGEMVEEITYPCFIATAACGTASAEEIDVLRAFRDEVLLQNSLGSQLVALYYEVSPPVADFISEHDGLRTLVREFLVEPVAWLLEATGTLWRD